MTVITWIELNCSVSAFCKTKYGEKSKPCYVNTDSFAVSIKTDDIYKDI